MPELWGILRIAAIAGLVWLFFKLFAAPIRLLFKLLLNTVVGFAALILVNFLGAFIGISIGVNWLNALVAGVLGVPGVALLLILQWLAVI